jgi:amiloride-sensitive sodium channel
VFRYKDSEYFALLRFQPFKLVDFLSYVGGILGLFAGISVLSIVELFYYFTLKLANDVVRYLRAI